MTVALVSKEARRSRSWLSRRRVTKASEAATSSRGWEDCLGGKGCVDFVDKECVVDFVVDRMVDAATGFAVDDVAPFFLGCFPRRDSLTSHLCPSARQLRHGIDSVTLHLTRRALHAMHACRARLPIGCIVASEWGVRGGNCELSVYRQEPYNSG